MSDKTSYFESLIDEERLTYFLEKELCEVEDYGFDRHREGHSNETIFVDWGDKELVLRRPPPGDVAETAHDVLREYHVLSALQDTDVRVPKTVLKCDDESVIGSDFYIMERVEGDVLRNEEPDRFSSPNKRKRIGEELVDRLAEIHNVDYEEVGLREFGKPEGYTERQVKRWSQQLMWAFSKTADEREVPTLYEVGDWLRDNVPENNDLTLVHGDYKLDNVIIDGGSDDEGPEIAAILDWEMSTLGNPLVDFGWMLSFWRDPKDPEPAIPEITSTFMENEDYPTREELVERYEKKTGFEFSDNRFYRTLAVYKLAGLGEMFYARYLEGNSDDPIYPLMEEGVPQLAERAKRIIEGEEPL